MPDAPRAGRSAADLLDGAAMVCSGACMAHCLILPAVLVALPALSLGAAGSEAAHPWLLAMAAGAAGPALILGYRRHRDRATLCMAVTGLMLLATGLAVGERAETMLTVAGSIAIVAAHLRNLKLRRRCAAGR